MANAKYYTGIGSREQSSEMLSIMQRIGTYLSRMGFILRSGAAEGADLSFQFGADPDMTEIWIPWRKFKPKDEAGIYRILTDEQFSIAREYLLRNNIIPWFDRMKPGAQKLHARNYFQVFGESGQVSDFCVYSAKVKGGQVQGGTRTAVEICKLNKIPVFNISIKNDLNQFKAFLKEHAELNNA